MAKEKTKHLEVDESTHKMIKEQALQANMSMKSYIRYCAIECKSDKKSK